LTGVDEWQRVFIAGGAAAGKSTLARKLSRRLDLPVFELDLGPTALDGFRIDSPWIVEGAQLWKIERFLELADVIIWLDLPLRVTVPRILRRHFWLSLRGRNRHRGLGLLVRFLRAQPRYVTSNAGPPTGPTDWDGLTRANTQEALNPHLDKVVHLQRPTAVRHWWRANGETRGQITVA
jgi:hypothetical protein